jgi:uncharacterized membrane protein YgcG
MRFMDFSSLQGIMLTLAGVALVTLIGVGIRLLVMMTIQQRRERMNRQINERLRTLIAAYKTLGGSFTGNLAVDPAHLRDFRGVGEPAPAEEAAQAVDLSSDALGSDRSRRIRDAVEAALSDILLLGTDEHVRLAERAARELVAGRSVHTHELVVSLRNYVRHALQLEPIPADLVASIPIQGPTRPSSSGAGRGKGGAYEVGRGAGSRNGGAEGGGGGSGGGEMAMGGVGIGAGISIDPVAAPPKR